MYCPNTSDGNLDFLDIMAILSAGLQFQNQIDFQNQPTNYQLKKQLDRIEMKLDFLIKSLPPQN